MAIASFHLRGLFIRAASIASKRDFRFDALNFLLSMLVTFSETGFISCFAEPQEAAEFLTYKRGRIN